MSFRGLYVGRKQSWAGHNDQSHGDALRRTRSTEAVDCHVSVNGWDVDDHKGHECAASVNTRREGAPRHDSEDSAGEGVRSPLVRLRGGRTAVVDDVEALRPDGVGMSQRGDGVAHLGQKAGCGSLPEASRSRLHMPSGEPAAQKSDEAPHGHGIACGEVNMHPRRTWRGRESGRPCGDGDEN